MIKKIALICLLLSTFCSFSSYARDDAASWCAYNAKVMKLKIGHVRSGQPGGEDSGDAVYVQFRGRKGHGDGYYPSESTFWLALNKGSNLDHDHGRALFSMLQSALLTGTRVHVFDHFGHLCDDFDVAELLAP